MTYSVKFTGATLISAFAIGVKFKGLNAVPGHARHLGYRYSPTHVPIGGLAPAAARLPSACICRPALRYGPPTVLRDASGWTVLRQAASAVPGHPASDTPFLLLSTCPYLCARVESSFRACGRTYTITEACYLFLLGFDSYFRSRAPYCLPGAQRTSPDRMSARQVQRPSNPTPCSLEFGFWVHTLRWQSR